MDITYSVVKLKQIIFLFLHKTVVSMLKNVSFIGLIALFLGVSSCETDFSLNGNYTPIPVVFGLLDHHDTTHIVKITKAFLGDGDNLVYAQNPDFKLIFNR